MSNFILAGVASNNFKAVLHLCINVEPQFPKKDCILGLQEDLPVKVLFSDEIIRGLTALFRLLCD